MPGTGLGILRDDKVESDSFAALPPEVRAKAREKQLLIITKANSRATVHRPAYLDYIGVKLFCAEGEVIGERRFLGLFTHVAYSESISRIPVLRRKLAEVLDRAGLAPDSHDGKDLIEILETFPRDELFQISVDELLPIALGVLRLRERKQVKLFLRRGRLRPLHLVPDLPAARPLHHQDPPADAGDPAARRSAAPPLDYSAMIGESALARLHVVVRGERGRPLPPTRVDVEELEARLAAATRSWEDDLADGDRRAVRRGGGRPADPPVRRRPSPRATRPTSRPGRPSPTCAGWRRWPAPTDEIGINLYEPYDAAEGERRLKIYRLGAPISLSQVLPLLQRHGRRGRGRAAVRDRPGQRPGDQERLDLRLRAALHAARRGRQETTSRGCSRTPSPPCGAARSRATGSTRSSCAPG